MRLSLPGKKKRGGGGNYLIEATNHPLQSSIRSKFLQLGCLSSWEQESAWEVEWKTLLNPDQERAEDSLLGDSVD